jgi:hypothetical protein
MPAAQPTSSRAIPRFTLTAYALRQHFAATIRATMSAVDPSAVYGPYPLPGARYNVIRPQLSRDGLVVHTYESVGDTLPLSRVRANLATPGTRPTASGGTYGACYHCFPQHPEGEGYFEVLDERHNPNAAGGTPNRRFLHFCLWGRAGQTRAQWFDTGSLPQLEALAAYIAAKSVEHGFPIRYLPCAGPNWGQTAEHRRNVQIVTSPGKVGIVGHRDITACEVWGGTHGDPGINFPWDWVITRATEIRDGDDMAKIVRPNHPETCQPEPHLLLVSGGTAEHVTLERADRMVGNRTASYGPDGTPWRWCAVNLLDYRAVEPMPYPSDWFLP